MPKNSIQLLCIGNRVRSAALIDIQRDLGGVTVILKAFMPGVQPFVECAQLLYRPKCGYAPYPAFRVTAENQIINVVNTMVINNYIADLEWHFF